ncbi:MAG: indolepyruvate ferredoxin oxidoreductase, partial [Bacteroides sp.]|nr:indolepyruvate ferredoxin oxidoreductase [Bacteroides sp.]
EAYDMTYNGFLFSEQMGEPVLMRMVTRLAHSRSGVERKALQPQNILSSCEDPRQFILLPGNARKRYKVLLERQEEFIKASEESVYNRYIDGPNKNLGIVACGIGYNYLMENYPEGCEYPVLKIGQYPLPKKQLLQLAEACDEILVLEDGQPFVEKQLKGYLGIGINVKGRLDGTLPQDGELTPDSVARALGKENKANFSPSSLVEMRPPALCEGCGHRDMYTVLTQVLKEEYPTHKVFSDIGCYTLGANAPFHAIHSCVDMGASITMAKGAADAGLYPAVAVIGDSTFTHSGMTGLLDCVNENADVTIVISDNETTAMTGGQDSAGTGRLEAICAGIGVAPEHIRIVVPLKKNYEEMKQVIREEVEYHGVSVIIPRRECIQTLARKKRNK